ncbi:hypothetical protein DV701_04565 [Ornithinimicrobium avium]|uniref:Uncharacterized protein n=2 Tax=Ornithinimicrobium avium TaxID=2283195 RepID=A0A345NKE1_9MICO|nr:hypothetical protein DV701_04565 [Ornithinimicrobium avium]
MGRSAVFSGFLGRVAKHPERARLILAEGRDARLVAAAVVAHAELLTLGDIADLILRSMGMVIRDAFMVLDAITALEKGFPAQFADLVDSARAECYRFGDGYRDELTNRLEAFKLTPLAAAPAREGRPRARAKDEICGAHDLETYLALVQRVNAPEQAARLLGSGSGPIPWIEVEHLARHEKIGRDMLRALAVLPEAPPGIIVAFAKKYGYPDYFRPGIVDDDDPTQNSATSLRWLRELVATPQASGGGISEARERLAWNVLIDPLLRREIETFNFPE